MKNIVNRLIIFLIHLIFILSNEIKADEIWNKFNSLTQSTHSLEEELDRASVLEKEGRYRSSWSFFLPKVTFVLKRQKDLMDNTPAILKNMGQFLHQFESNLIYEWDLFQPNYLIEFKSRSLELEKTRLIEDADRSKKERQKKSDLLAWLLSKYKQSTIKTSLEKSAQAKKEAETQLRLGAKTKTDLLRANAAYISLTSKQLNFNDEEQLSRKNLLINYQIKDSTFEELNKFIEKEDMLYAAIEEIVDMKNLDEEFKKIHIEKMEETLSYKKAKIEYQMATNASKNYMANDLPTLKLTGNYSWDDDKLAGVLNNRAQMKSHVLILQLTVPIFSWGSGFFNYNAASAVELASKIKLRKEEKDLVNRIESTKQKIEADKTLLDSLQLNISQYEELNKLTEKSYRLGKSSMMELLDAEDNYLNAKINYASQLIQHYNLASGYFTELGVISGH